MMLAKTREHTILGIILPILVDYINTDDIPIRNLYRQNRVVNS